MKNVNLIKILIFLQNAGIRGGEREKRPVNPRARQKKQPVGGKGQVRHHVELPMFRRQLIYNFVAVFNRRITHFETYNIK